MCLSRLRPGLVRSLWGIPAHATFMDATTRHPELEEYTTLGCMLLELQDTSEKTYPRRDLLTRIFVEEAQRTKHSAWTSALIVAYLPMLRRLRSRLVSPTISRDDLDQLVIESFLVVIATFPLAKRIDRAPMYLRQDTQRAVFRSLRLDQRATEDMRQMLAELGDEPEVDPLRLSASNTDLDDEEKGELEHVLRGHLERESTEASVVELVCRTTIGGESVAALVRTDHPQANEPEQYRLYNRLKRRRERALTRVRRRLEECADAAE